MSLDPDLLLDRRRLKRGRAIWRALAVLAVCAALAAWFGTAGIGDEQFARLGAARSPVVRLEVRGTITDDRDVTDAIDRAADDAAVRGLILAVDSPGGTLAGGESIHAALTRFRERGKPIVAVMGGTAASAGYMISLPAERILARDSTLTGSIGVLLQSFNVSELLRNLGIRPLTLASGPLKAQPNPFEPLSEDGRRVLEGVMADLQNRFVGMVAAGRRMPEDRVRALADGRIYTGRQALENGLIDAIGGEREARAHLLAAHGIPAAPRARDLDTTGRTTLPRLALGFAEDVVSALFVRFGVVDGAWAVWQPAVYRSGSR